MVLVFSIAWKCSRGLPALPRVKKAEEGLEVGTEWLLRMAYSEVTARCAGEVAAFPGRKCDHNPRDVTGA